MKHLKIFGFIIVTLHEHYGICDHQQLDCLFRLTIKKYQTSALLGLCEVNSSVISGFPSQRASNAESVSMSRCLHDQVNFCGNIISKIVNKFKFYLYSAYLLQHSNFSAIVFPLEWMCILHCQYQGYWCPGDATGDLHRQDISSNDMDPISLKTSNRDQIDHPWRRDMGYLQGIQSLIYVIYS